MKWINERYEILGYFCSLMVFEIVSQRFFFCICPVNTIELQHCYHIMLQSSLSIVHHYKIYAFVCMLTSVSWANGWMWKKLVCVMHLHKLTNTFYLTCFVASTHYCFIIYDFKEVDVKTKGGKGVWEVGNCHPRWIM